ncbi:MULTISPECIES: ABC transporter ATP-binding protein [Bacillaceae]|uniref:ABC transporter ATP-binding protein n=1 Tax=Shouchella lehensis TaxID=300825 RepID=A0A4Y7WPU7_9BACI|nr:MULTISPECIES: ABC transporter ATP-binding protein [Bacillaceae]RQW20516.1 ABC transporter ATP-binding protein [Bacillus sp. C1-1]TES50532.1 ABC transporter ATP-binding protein [Shouchella lehensis]
MLDVQEVSVRYGDRTVLNNISFSVKKGEMVGILGENGSGKTTLLQGITGVKSFQSGQVLFNDEPLERMKAKQRARKLAVLTQEPFSAFHTTVQSVVELGRYPYLHGLLPQLSKADRIMIDHAMKETKVNTLAHRSMLTLSGGERQRVWLAQALAQGPELLLLDEPTNHLDLAHQVVLMDYLHQQVKKNALTVVCILHDVNLASLYCDNVLLLKAGNVQGYGETQQQLTRDRLRTLYGTPFSETIEQHSGRKQFSVLPYYVDGGG